MWILDVVFASFALFTGSYNLQEYWELDLFWASSGRLCRLFQNFAFFDPTIRITRIFNASKNWFFLRRTFWATNKIDQIEP